VLISKAGLKARARKNAEGDDETIFLRPLEEILVKKATLADEMLALFNGRWEGSVEPAFKDYAY